MTEAQPILPEFGGACLTSIVPSLMAALYGPGDGRLGDGETAPAWVPEPVLGASQIVLLVLDGLGFEQLRDRAAMAPVLASGVGGPVTSVAPSTTACALTSLATGRPPAAHGVVGYRISQGDQIMNVLQWTVGGVDARTTLPPPVFQPCPTFAGSPTPVPVVTRYDYGPTGFTAAHLGEVELHRWHTQAGLLTGVRSQLQAGSRFVYAYYEGMDKVAHAYGLGQHYEDELRGVDRLVGDLRSVLPPGAVLVVTADHGQVEVGNSVEVLGGELMNAITLLSGEGRFRWLHVKPGTAVDVAEAAREIYDDVAWVFTKEHIVSEGWLGGVPSSEVLARMGDVVLAPHTATAFMDPSDTGELRLLARHGSLTSAEMFVPLLSWPSS